MPSPPNPISEPISMFELERRRRGLDPGAAEPSDEIPQLPSSSPWSGTNPGPGDEPTINREEDSDVMGTPIDQLP